MKAGVDINKRSRGRPAGVMTHNRRRVLAEYQASAERGERISLAELARRCGLYDFRDARRTWRDLQRIGAVS